MIACACCGGEAAVFARIDSARSCEDRRARAFPPSGELVTCHRCRRCSFIFCLDFDGLSDAQMVERIYNADDIRADPEFAEMRPRHLAGVLTNLLRDAPPAATARSPR